MIAHSVLSHVATWQMDQALSAVRDQITGEGKFLVGVCLMKTRWIERGLLRSFILPFRHIDS